MLLKEIKGKRSTKIQRHGTFIDWDSQHSKDTNCTQIDV